MTQSYHAADFDYELPPELVAQYAAPRGASRLLVLPGPDGGVAHHQFADIVEWPVRGDVVVVNTSRVMRARLRGRRDNGAPAELLLLRPEPDGTWLALGHPGGKLKPGRRVWFGDDQAEVEVMARLGGGLRRVRWLGPMDPIEVMNRYGAVPLPPYIHRAPDESDVERYQTVYADTPGSAAAPTAGLHFTAEHLAALERRGVTVSGLVLHVGVGTFKPLCDPDLSQHHMHEEWFDIPAATAAVINEALRRGNACWAVGTTTVRALESAVNEEGTVRPGSGFTSLFIRPGYRFRAVQHLVTNFHLPRSTLLVLVAAFGGYDAVMQAYRIAVSHRYRFYSYGDAMLVSSAHSVSTHHV